MSNTTPLGQQELETLIKIGKSVTTQLDLKAVLRRVAQAAVELTGADESYLLLADVATGELYLRSEANLGEEQARDFRIKTSDSFAGHVFTSGQPLLLSRDDSTLKVKTGLSVYSLVNVPLLVGGATLGVLGINNRHQKRAFTPADVKRLAALADWAAIAIQNARLFDEVQEFNRDLQLVNEVSRLMSGTLDVAQIPHVLLQRVAEIVGAECGSLALIDRARDGVVFQLAYDSEGRELKEMTGLLLPRGEGIVGVVADTGQPIIANDARHHSAWSALPDQITGFVTRKIIAVPLLARGEIIGVVELLNKLEGDFVETDVKLLTLVASSAAIAIQNARHFAELEAAHRALATAQEQRIAAERWAVLGKAAATLAHRINNSTALVPIAAQHTRELLAGVELPPELRQDIEENLGRIERNSLYTVEIAGVLLRRFRKNPVQAHDINQLLARALALVEIPADITVIRHLDPNLPEVNTSDLLTDVFVELLSNAVRALAGRPDAVLRVASFKAGVGQVSVQITDNGPGIAPENMDKLFDMFFTTTSNGLGFGLWWVKTFLEQQGGEVRAESVPGKSTTFTVTVPTNSPSLRSLLK